MLTGSKYNRIIDHAVVWRRKRSRKVQFWQDIMRYLFVLKNVCRDRYKEGNVRLLWLLKYDLVNRGLCSVKLVEREFVNGFLVHREEKE